MKQSASKTAGLKLATEAIEALEALHPERLPEEWHPWQTGDHPLAMQHWTLVQARLNVQNSR